MVLHAREHIPADASSPVLAPETLRAIAREFLSYTAADTASVTVNHIAIGMARIALGRVRMQDNGDEMQLSLVTQFGQRALVGMTMTQVDATSLRQAAAYLDRAARELPGDPASLVMPVSPRTYLPTTTWRVSTAAAFQGARHAAVASLIEPVLDAGMSASAFVGAYARSTAYANKQGVMAAGAETDAELVVTGWASDGVSSGWAGHAARDWTTLDPDRVAQRVIEMTRRAEHPVAFEPGRHTVILDRPAVAQIVRAMGTCFDARRTLSGSTPLYNPATRRARLGERIMDARVTISSDPNDPDGGYLPFNRVGDPLRAMTWVDHGVHAHLAFRADFAAQMGYAAANDPPSALRVTCTSKTDMVTVEEMIASCSDGVYVNRLSYIDGAGDDPTVGLLTGVTSGGCFLVRKGKIGKAIKNLRFVDSPWLFLNRIEAIGVPERAPFGYAPWAGNWPIDPTIVPPLMIRDFNFSALADAV